MDHQAAVDTHAVERYLLDEMSAEERDRFEEHYFDCPVCGAEVTQGVVFAENLREVAKEDAAKPKVYSMPVRGGSSGFTRWVPFGLAAGLALVSVYQQTVLQRIDTTQSVVGVALFPESRGEDTKVKRADVGRFFVLPVDLNPPSGTLEGITKVEWRIIQSGRVTAEGTARPDPVIHLLLASREFPRGKYQLLLNGSGEDRAKAFEQRFRFEIE